MPDAPLSQMIHAVFFELHESNAAHREALAEGCRKFLANQPGVVHFSVGCRAEAYSRPVNDQRFEVALVLVFASQADHDRYQQSPEHQQFIAEHLPACSRVRVFDALTS